MSDLEIEVKRREGTGSNANRRLRAAGAIPAVVYGGELESVPIQVERKALYDLFRKGGGENSVFLLKVPGTRQKRHAMIRDMQVDPISRQIAHIDFLRINLAEKIKVQVQIELVGEPEGVRNEGGVVDFVTREVEVESLPGNIPQSLAVDISSLHIGQHVEAGEIELPEGVELMIEPERVLVSVAHGRLEIEEEEEAAAAEEELLEAAKAEPEVIGRGKEDEEADREE